MRGPDGQIVAWEPCSPIPYRLLRPGIPEGGVAAIDGILEEVADLSGYRFVHVGWSEQAPRAIGELRGHALIGWVDPGQATAFDTGEPDAAGRGGLSAVNGRAVGGFAVVRHPGHGQPQIDDRTSDVLRHEVGHLLGLGHVDDPRQLMHPTGRRHGHGYGDGDISGLRTLAELGCRHRRRARRAR